MACANPLYLSERHRAHDELEAKITELWGHLNAATYRFLSLVAQFDRAKAFERHGLANTAQWLNWQCGIGAVAAREKVRVARALEQLPEIADAFAKGEISYSKVRAMTRVATAANESVLVHVARDGTAAHVEKLVRKYRWTQRRDAATVVAAQARAAQRLVLLRRDGEFVLNARLPPEIGAVVARRSRSLSKQCVSREMFPRKLRCRLRPTRTAPTPCGTSPRNSSSNGAETGGGSSGDRVQVVVHIDQAILVGAPLRTTTSRTAASSTTVPRSRSTRPGGWPATRQPSGSSKARTASHLASAASPAAFRRRLRGRCALATAAAASRAAIARASPKAITSSTGPMEGKQSSVTS